MKTLIRKRKKGFTLIELMIVIAIIAILAAILIPNFIRARAQSQLAACEANLKNTATAMEMYATDWSGQYGPVAAQWAAFPALGAQGSLLPNYLKTYPVCPTNSTAYLYAIGAGSTTYSAIQAPVATAVHAAVGIIAGRPAYDASRGLMTK